MYQISTANIPVGERLQKFCLSVGKHNHRYLGYSDFISRVQNRIHKSATTVSRHKRNKPSIKIVRKVCAIRGGSRFITKTGYRISTRVRQRKGLLQPILFGSQEGRGLLRPILNLRPLNKFVKSPRFKMQTLRSIIQAVQPGEWLAKIDLKYAYFQIPIHPHHRQFLRFSLEGNCYQYRALPFGLTSKGLHQSHGSISCSSAQAADSNIHVSGRLADKGTEPKKSTHSSGSPNGGSTPSRVDPKLGKVCTYSCSEDKLLGNGFQFNRGQSETYRRAVSVSLPDHCNGVKKHTGASQLLSKNTGPDGHMYRHGTMGKVANETHSVVPTVKMATARPTNRRFAHIP